MRASLLNQYNKNKEDEDTSDETPPAEARLGSYTVGSGRAEGLSVTIVTLLCSVLLLLI